MKDYVRGKKIGQGSFGKVFLVTRISDNFECVEKEIGLDGISDKDRAEIKKEIEVLKMLDHAFIARYLDSFADDGGMHIILEYASGGTLQQQCKLVQEGKLVLSESEVLDWFVQCLLSMEFVHNKGILHRDIKSANVFLSGGNPNTCKLGDFGLARVLGSQSNFAATMVGTPYYMSPELVEGSMYDGRSDVWALGCLLHELFTGSVPFTANNFGALVLKIMTCKPPPLPTTVSQDSRNLVASMLARQPEQRPTVSKILQEAFLKPYVEKWRKHAEQDTIALTPAVKASASPASRTESASTVSGSMKSSDSGKPSTSSAGVRSEPEGPPTLLGVSQAQSLHQASKRGSVGGCFLWGFGQEEPKCVEGLIEHNLAEVVVGGSTKPFYAARTIEGSVLTWGSGTWGQLGQGHRRDAKQPVPISSIPTKIISVAAGADHLILVAEGGAVFSCGRNDSGQLGLGPNALDSPTPMCVSSVPNSELTYKNAVIAIAGPSTSGVITKDGMLFAWGRSFEGQLGTVKNPPPKTDMPTQVSTLSKRGVMAAAFGSEHSACIDNDGNIYTFGSRDFGRLGHNEDGDVTIPKVVEALKSKKGIAVAVGSTHTVALVSPGIVYCWGENSSGQCAQPFSSSVSIPTPVKMRGAIVVSIAAGDCFSALRTENHKVWTWGKNENRRLGHGAANPSKNASVPHIVAGIATKICQNISCGYIGTAVIIKAQDEEEGSDVFEL